jgi:hypothetical protein
MRLVRADRFLNPYLGLNPRLSPLIPSSFVILHYGGQVGIGSVRRFKPHNSGHPRPSGGRFPAILPPLLGEVPPRQEYLVL